jgi:hypothetical protein
MSKLFIHECGGNLGNMTNRIEISIPVDFALVIGNKSYRMQSDKDGNLLISLINGIDAEFISRQGNPVICLTQQYNTSDNWYESLKEDYGT